MLCTNVYQGMKKTNVTTSTQSCRSKFSIAHTIDGFRYLGPCHSFSTHFTCRRPANMERYRPLFIFINTFRQLQIRRCEILLINNLFTLEINVAGIQQCIGMFQPCLPSGHSLIGRQPEIHTPFWRIAIVRDVEKGSGDGRINIRSFVTLSNTAIHFASAPNPDHD